MNLDIWDTDHGDVVEVYRADDGWRWRVRAAGNHEIVGSGEAHPARSAARQAALRHHPRVEVSDD